MSRTNKIVTSQSIAPSDSSITMRELAAVLVKHFELHEGLYDLIMEFQIGVGPVGPNIESISPGVMIGAAGVGLRRTISNGPLTVDAASVNPVKKSRTPRKIG